MGLSLISGFCASHNNGEPPGVAKERSLCTCLRYLSPSVAISTQLNFALDPRVQNCSGSTFFGGVVFIFSTAFAKKPEMFCCINTQITK